MNLKPITAIFGRRTKRVEMTPVAPDPAINFPNPENAELFAYFRENSNLATADKDPMWVREGYEIRSHPDLESYLFPLIEEDGLKKGFAFGRPVIANSNGLVFAWAGGTHYIMLRLQENRHNDARLDGGRSDLGPAKEWVEFKVGGRYWSSSNWKDAMERWATISYQDSMSPSR